MPTLATALKQDLAAAGDGDGGSLGDTSRQAIPKDTGRLIEGNWVDVLYLESEKAAREWGRRQVEVRMDDVPK